jgi:hypothetical protein
MSFVINPYRFAAAGAAPALPLHWYDLDNITTGLVDVGEGTTYTMATSGAVANSSGTGMNSQDVIDIPSGSFLQSGNRQWDGSGVDVTVAIWANYDALDSNGGSLFEWRSNSTGLMALGGFPATTDYVFAQVWDDGQDQVNTFGDDTASLTTGGTTWAHYAFTWDGTTMRMYKDGVETATSTNASVGTPLEQTAVLMQIGTRGTFTTNDFDGKVTMCGIWDTVLTADEISTSLYNGGNGNFYSDIWT